MRVRTSLGESATPWSAGRVFSIRDRWLAFSAQGSGIICGRANRESFRPPLLTSEDRRVPFGHLMLLSAGESACPTGGPELTEAPVPGRHSPICQAVGRHLAREHVLDKPVNSHAPRLLVACRMQASIGRRKRLPHSRVGDQTLASMATASGGGKLTCAGWAVAIIAPSALGGCGEIGRRARLRIWSSREGGGSSPLIRTNTALAHLRWQRSYCALQVVALP